MWIFQSRRAKLLAILRETVQWLALPGTDFTWSTWENAEEAIAELQAHITAIEAGESVSASALEILFAPTGDIQEASLGGGWSDDYVKLASRFDRVIAGW